MTRCAKDSLSRVFHRRLGKLQGFLFVLTTTVGCANSLATQIQGIAAPKLECPASDVDVHPDDEKRGDSSWIASCDMLMVYVDCDANQTCTIRPPAEPPRSWGLDPLSGP